MKKPDRSPQHKRLLQELHDRSHQAGDVWREMVKIGDKESPDYLRLSEKYRDLTSKTDQISRKIKPYDDRFLQDLQAYNRYEKEENERQQRQAIVDAENDKAEQSRALFLQRQAEEKNRHDARFAELDHAHAEAEAARKFKAEEAKKQREHEERMAKIELLKLEEQRKAAESARDAAALARAQESEQFAAILKSLRKDES